MYQHIALALATLCVKNVGMNCELIFIWCFLAISATSKNASARVLAVGHGAGVEVLLRSCRRPWLSGENFIHKYFGFQVKNEILIL